MLLDMFKGVVQLSIAPFFGLETLSDDENAEKMKLGEERYGWRLVGEGEVRGSWA